eukprot:TRINITY_DN1672_c0_g1_i4.p1 TRINITY_DN1672_c0_g1~~TRINITY_DN1672_c0_g1_i4.p1  ORF type:complete len:232 (+),score=38.59 TRINITY_DN1672_c0_g1_i4:82-696(+)
MRSTNIAVLVLVLTVGVTMGKKSKIDDGDDISYDKIETTWDASYMACPACEAFANEIDIWSNKSRQQPYAGYFKYKEEKEEWIKEKSIDRIANDFAFVVQDPGGDGYAKSGQFLPYSLLRHLRISSDKESEKELDKLDEYPFIGVETFLQDFADQREDLILRLLAVEAPYSIFFNRVCAGINSDHHPVCAPITDGMESDVRYKL